MSIVIIAIIAVICSAAGCYAGYSITSKIVRNKKAAILKEAESAGEMIKKEKILQAKEKFIQLKRPPLSCFRSGCSWLRRY